MSSGTLAKALETLNRCGVKVAVENCSIRVSYRCKAASLPAVRNAIAVLRQHRDEAIACLTRATVTRSLVRPGWPPASLEAERKFGHPAARLYPFLNQRVRTPKGTGVLLQVFGDRATVLLDTELTRPQHARRLSYFDPADVCPPSIM